MNIIFSKSAFKDYVYWQKENKKISSKINDLIKDISRHPFSGKGKPEPLKNELSAYWSIDKEHRLVYKVENDNLYIIACRYHYE